MAAVNIRGQWFDIHQGDFFFFLSGLKEKEWL